MSCDNRCKISLIGSEGAGKTCLAETYILGYFTGISSSTIGASFVSKKVLVDEIHIKLDIWDTAGQERFNSLLPMYIRGSYAVLICLETPDETLFYRYLEYCLQYSSQSKIYIVFTKCDMNGDYDYRDIENKILNEKISEIWYTSSKTGENINKLFEDIARNYTSHIPRKSVEENKVDILGSSNVNMCSC